MAITAAAAQLEVVLSVKFPGVRFGRYKCRTIAGSSTYSQHSWGNARDLYAPVDHPDPKAFIDKVMAFIEENREPLNIKLTLWQVRDHYSHGHVDFWPHGYDVPPCDGGELQFSYPDGTVEEGKAELINRWEEPEVTEEVSNPLFQASWDKAHKEGMYTEWTKPSDVVTAEKLAVFLDRLGLLEAQEEK